MTRTTIVAPLFLLLVPIVLAANATDTNQTDVDLTLLEAFEIEKRPFHGWSAWSEWSGCSRTCGSGVRHQLRRCLGKECAGESAKQQLCETDRCPENAASFRQVQCSAYDNQLYRGRIFDRWIPTDGDPREQCALHCRSQSHGFVVKLAPKVVDGTDCSLNATSDSAICVDGKCLAVGCDGMIGSGRGRDECGVCGGNGESCGRPVFVWQETYQFSPCDRSCGSDSWRVSVSVCMNSKTQRVVPEKFCADKERPRPIIEKCLHIVCPAE
uniref:ADAMTS/ADAMTS-like cysteine-rich domain-containing protein n=1 Tax=Plectus sambesii TaxID=2011161 RepID=A0A914WYZ9_9BILA